MTQSSQSSTVPASEYDALIDLLGFVVQQHPSKTPRDFVYEARRQLDDAAASCILLKGERAADLFDEEIANG